MVAFISCIIPARDEAARVARVVEVAAAHPDLAEVIVVDDGSADGTGAIAAAAGARVLRREAPGGKARAIARGLAAAQAPLVMLLDADLEGLGAAEIDRLADPVLSGRADMAISLRGDAPAPWRALGLDYVSGERVFARSLVEGRTGDIAALPPIGLEIWLNRLAIAQGLRVAVAPWPGVRNPARAQKKPLWTGAGADAAMIREVIDSVSPATAARQIRDMRRLRAS